MKNYSVAMAGTAIGLIVMLAFITFNNLNTEVLTVTNVSSHAAAPASVSAKDTIKQIVRVTPYAKQSVTVAE